MEEGCWPQHTTSACKGNLLNGLAKVLHPPGLPAKSFQSHQIILLIEERGKSPLMQLNCLREQVCVFSIKYNQRAQCYTK